jgi:hypothetical protein
MIKLNIAITFLILIFISCTFNHPNHSKKGVSAIGYGRKMDLKKHKSNRKYDVNKWLDSISRADSLRIDSCKSNLSDPIRCKERGLRNKSSFLRTVIKKLESLRKEYNKYLARDKSLKGRIDVKITIIQSGEVIKSEFIRSTFPNTIFSLFVVNQVKKWKFEYIDEENDTSTIKYPFVFTY